jgi:DNA replication protein DnaC
LISRAYEYQSLVATSNLPFDKRPTIISCGRLTGALLDRIMQRCHIMEVTGEATDRAMGQKKLTTVANLNF